MEEGPCEGAQMAAVLQQHGNPLQDSGPQGPRSWTFQPPEWGGINFSRLSHPVLRSYCGNVSRIRHPCSWGAFQQTTVLLWASVSLRVKGECWAKEISVTPSCPGMCEATTIQGGKRLNTKAASRTVSGHLLREAGGGWCSKPRRLP